MPKSMTLRLPDEQAAQIEMIARIEGVPVAVVIREAIEAAIEARQKDEAFHARLREHLAEYRSQLDQLTDGIGRRDETEPVTVRFKAKDIDAVVEATKIVPRPPADPQP
ncbi:MAG TPA: ribbon-helix-helix protein, CopG family [Solirubrobacteraceae bacterium]|nr:ribbon-helix-helix protein, CopG family [Solirubrobacteraceae bacterium]